MSGAQYLIAAAAMILAWFADRLTRRKYQKLMMNKDHPEASGYSVKMSKQFKQVYSVIYWFGMGLFFLVYLLILSGQVPITTAWLNAGLVIAFVGLIIVIAAERYEVSVTDSTLLIQVGFARVKKCKMTDLDHVERSKNGGLILRRKGRTLTTVNPGMENFARLVSTLTRFQKL
ncbi:MAG: hypothetical protein LKF79_06965 [Solobacterium sp.]|jgi:hypothetical protein|nr:hypothetical protein [Solobacterium sp.]MCH4222956.1 hypothetical protein [Solobacterium sp.]MCH4266365.1 hypothetical protein [Solobacterium sp.]